MKFNKYRGPSIMDSSVAIRVRTTCGVECIEARLDGGLLGSMRRALGMRVSYICVPHGDMQARLLLDCFLGESWARR